MLIWLVNMALKSINRLNRVRFTICETKKYFCTLYQTPYLTQEMKYFLIWWMPVTLNELGDQLRIIDFETRQFPCKKNISFVLLFVWLWSFGSYTRTKAQILASSEQMYQWTFLFNNDNLTRLENNIITSDICLKYFKTYLLSCLFDFLIVQSIKIHVNVRSIIYKRTNTDWIVSSEYLLIRIYLISLYICVEEHTF